MTSFTATREIICISSGMSGGRGLQGETRLRAETKRLVRRGIRPQDGRAKWAESGGVHPTAGDVCSISSDYMLKLSLVL